MCHPSDCCLFNDLGWDSRERSAGFVNRTDITVKDRFLISSLEFMPAGTSDRLWHRLSEGTH